LTTVDSAADALQGGLGMPYRTLGRAGLKVSVLGLGTSQIDDPAVARRCLDFGINYFDTADCYMGGNSEVALGKALRGHRDKAIIATKWHPHDNRPVRELIASVDTSLRRLGIDHIDLIQVHGATNISHATGETGWEAFNRLKEAGKVRFNGLSTHENRVEVVRAAIKSGHYDAVLVKHNAMTADTMKPVIRESP
ncbi:MAG: aldo/keto reductase, partial [Armatimonadetes bacterium]|nr:aldo/keto reductase [Armatimonadota bacterium]